ncbi:MAG: multicopper oxidase family protein [Candidatus Eremiobacteraeota bacterium]|nr:multicopper oxidase family protein [Candidatus Eremiobacteraeota bacterium]
MSARSLKVIYASKRFTVVAVAFLTLVASRLPAPASASALPPELPTLPEVRSVHDVAYLALKAALNPATGLPAFYYAGSTVPPTIRIHPGDSIVIDYTNDLPRETQAPLDISNLHFHGLSVSPKMPGDQTIMTMVAPGQTYRYVVNVPRNEPPGLYWYHPHPHGESNRQVAAGMSGLIIIDGVEKYAPYLRGLAERDIIIRDYYFDPSTAPFSRVRRRAIVQTAARERQANPGLSVADSIRSAAAHPSSLAPAAYTPDCATADASNGTTINGLPEATISQRPGARQLYRVANASANSFYDLKIDGTKLIVVASDGVPLGYHDRAMTGRLEDHVLLAPAARVEFITASPVANGAALRSACTDYGPDGDVDPDLVLARFSLRGEPAARRGGADATNAPAATARPLGEMKIAAQRSVDFTEDNPDSLFYLNGQLYNPTGPPMFVAHTGTIEEWTLRNYAEELHAFHIHQVHFLVLDVNGVKAPPNTWRDTLMLPYAQSLAKGAKIPSVSHVIVDFRDPIVAGTFVFHCHILEHEDGGMMAKITVIDPSKDTAAYRFGMFVNQWLAFAVSLPSKLFGGNDALASFAHMCGLRNVATQPAAPARSLRSDRARVALRSNASPL